MKKRLILALAILFPILSLVSISCSNSSSSVSTSTLTPTPVLPDQMVLVPLTTETLTPSSTDQQVSWNGQVTVTVPGGLLTDSETLTISCVDNAPPDKFVGFTQLAAYDVSLGGLKEFNQSLTIEIAYDPTQLQSDLPPDQSICTEWWDASQNTWCRAVSQVDAQRNVVVISTDHLTRWRITMLARGDQELTSKHFVVVWNPKEAPTIAGVPQAPQAFAQTVANYLEAAYQQYFAERYDVVPASVDEGDQWPSDWPFISAEIGRTWVVINQSIAESETDWATGDITLKSRYDNDDQVKHDTAHELFHTTYLRQVRPPTYLQSHWWAEATADYAATRVAWPNLNGMANVSADYFLSPLTTVDSVHEYETARFIEYLVGQGVSFNQLFNDMANAGVATTESLSTVVQNITGKNLLEQHRDFAAYVFFDSTGPINPIALTPSLLKGLTASKGSPDTLSASATDISWQMSVNGGYTARLWGFKVAASSSTASRTLQIQLTPVSGDNLPIGKVSVGVYVLKNDQRVPGGAKRLAVLSGDMPSANISVSDGDVVYILGANADAEGHAFDVDVKDVTVNAKDMLSGTINFTDGVYASLADKNMKVLTVSGSWQVNAKGISVSESPYNNQYFYFYVDSGVPVHLVVNAKGTVSPTEDQWGSYTVNFTVPDPGSGITVTKSDTGATFDFTVPKGGDIQLINLKFTVNGAGDPYGMGDQYIGLIALTFEQKP